MRLGHRRGGRGLRPIFPPGVKAICVFCSVEVKAWTFERSSAPATSSEGQAQLQLISIVVLDNYFFRGRAPSKPCDSYLNGSKCTLIFTLSSFRRKKGNRRKKGLGDQIFIISRQKCIYFVHNCSVKDCLFFHHTEEYILL